MGTKCPKFCTVHSCKDNLGGWVIITMNEMEQTDLDNLMKRIATVFIHLADVISTSLAE
jgi:hypothetical protein